MDAIQIPRMTTDEKAPHSALSFRPGQESRDIARLPQRSLSSINRLFAQRQAPRKIGRPQKLTGANVDRIVATVEKMVHTADGNEEIILHMIMRRCRVKASQCSVSNALHRRGYRFRNMRQKPILTPTDIQERFRWVRRCHKK